MVVDNFEKVKGKLESLDCLLATDDMDSVSKHVERLRQGGAVSDISAPYLVFQVQLYGGAEERFSQIYLRGFERAFDSDSEVANYFLEELVSLVGSYLDLPKEWPKVAGKEEHEHTVPTEKNGLRLKITALIGGRYTLRNETICVGCKSTDFGLPSRPDELLLHGMLQQLMSRKTPYNVFRNSSINPFI